jgi:hypothetical protein
MRSEQKVASDRWWVVPLEGAGVEGEGGTMMCGSWALDQCRNERLPVDEKLILLILGLEYPNGCDDPERLAEMVGMRAPQVVDVLDRLVGSRPADRPPDPAPCP